MTAANAAISGAFDFFFAPFAAKPWLAITVASLGTSLLALLVFRYTSDQRRLRAVKDGIVASLLELYLFRDEPTAILRAQGRLFVGSLCYLAHALVPLTVMFVPIAVVLVQTDLHYGHRPLKVGERAVIAVKLRQGLVSPDAVTLSATPGLRVETPALRIPSLRELDWRVRAITPGRQQVRVKVGSRALGKLVLVGEMGGGVSVRRTRGGLQSFLHPGECPLAAGAPIEWIQVAYPEERLSLFGRKVAWVWPWLALSMIFAQAFKRPLQVQV
jgi:hypothetical protein